MYCTRHVRYADDAFTIVAQEKKNTAMQTVLSSGRTRLERDILVEGHIGTIDASPDAKASADVASPDAKNPYDLRQNPKPSVRTQALRCLE